MSFLCKKNMKIIFSKLIFRFIGWKIIGEHSLPDKCLIIGAPHTSNWDFFIGRCYGYILGIDAKYLIKSELFLPVLGFLLRINGGIPVYRHSKNNFVDQIIEMYRKKDKFILGISPEGTRRRVKKWKTGFYYIAKGANVPIFLLRVDYKNKEIGIINKMYVSDDFNKDMSFIQKHFEKSHAKKPNNYNQIIS